MSTTTPLSARGSRVNEVFPVEILSLVFVEFTETRLLEWSQNLVQNGNDKELHPSAGFTYAGDVPGVVLSHVCSHWRSIALTTPSMWRFVLINDDTPLLRTQEVLRRGKAVPILISAYLSATICLNRGSEIVQLLLRHVSRWQFVVWAHLGLGLTQQLLSGLAGARAPYLETLRVDNRGLAEQREIEVEQEASDLFDGASSVPCLKMVQLMAVELRWETQPFRDLTYLELGCLSRTARPSVQEFLAVLQSSPLLEELTIRQGAIDSSRLALAFTQNPQPSPAQLLALRYLVLADFNSNRNVCNTLRLFHSPNLASITFSNNFSRLWDFDPVLRFMRSTFPRWTNLDSLKLVRMWLVRPEAMERALEALPSLRQLQIVTHSWSDELRLEKTERYLRTFLPPHVREQNGWRHLNNPCPNLVELATAGVPGLLLLRIASARYQMGHPLEMIVYDSEDGLTETCLEQLDELGVYTQERSG